MDPVIFQKLGDIKVLHQLSVFLSGDEDKYFNQCSNLAIVRKNNSSVFSLGKIFLSLTLKLIHHGKEKNNYCG